MKKVLVTGGAGFIGSHLVDAYVAEGYRVCVIDDLSTGRRGNVNAAAELVEMSVQDDRLAQVFERVGGFDIVSHHAAQADVRKSVADPRFDCAVNLDGLLNVLECARRYGTGRVLFASSGGVVYGEPQHRPTPEEYPRRPVSPYGVSKLAGEHYLDCFGAIHGMESIALRYANVYGPRQDPHGEAGVVAIFCSRVLDDAPLTIFGDGEQTRDYVYVGDVVAANMILSGCSLPDAEGDFNTRAFNVGTQEETSVIQLAGALFSASGRRVPLQHADARAGELRNSALDTRKLRALGWRPETSLEDGLRSVYSHVAGASR